MKYNIKNNRIIRILKLSHKAFGQYKWQIVILLVLGFLGGLLEGIGVNALIPLLSFASGVDYGDDMVSRYIGQMFYFFHISFSVKYLLIFICLLFIGKAAALFFSSYIRIKIAADYEEKTRNELFEKTIKADWPYLLKQKLGHLETILAVNVGHGSSLLQSIGGVCVLGIGLLVYIFIAINISLTITLTTLVIGLILFLIFKPFVYKTRTVARETAGLLKTISHFVNENIIGIKTVKTMFAGDAVIDRGRGYFRFLRSNNIRIFMLKMTTGTLMQPISLVFICIVFAISYKTPDFNFAYLVAIVYLIQKIFEYIRQIQASIQSAGESASYLQGLLEYKDQAVSNEEKSRSDKRFIFNDTVKFNDVYFGYNSNAPVLSGINFSIKRGEVIGLIGSSGAGKTTIVDLMLRLLSPDKGEILVDGVSAADISLKEWRNNIGYVSQDIFLINDTIANNIKFYDNSIADGRMIEVAKMANIHDFILSCPDGFSTMVGERGVMLSAGQRQRVVIARVLARHPQILILDEATSALDNESEIKIQKVIDNLKGSITVFVIAHRLSTVLDCDRIMALDKGRIAEEGRPRELLKDKDSYFFKVYNIRK